MSLATYERAVRLIRQNDDLSDFEGEQSDELIAAGERALSVTLPEAYRRFLHDFGAGNFGSQEIYGVFRPDFENSGVPDAVWYTLACRNNKGLPSRYVAVHNTGSGELLCLDLSAAADGDAPVVCFEHKDKPVEVAYPGFGEMLLDLVESEIEGE